MSNKLISKCMFCDSTAYGPGCPYSPHKKHVHITNGHTCIYCGSASIGTGCPYNPFGKNHVRGIDYNAMTKESVYQSVMAALFLERLTQPIKEMPAFKLGIIDEKGCKIKEVITEEEKASFKPLDQYIIKIRRLIGEHIVDLFKSNILLEMSSNTEKFDAEKYQLEVAMTSRIDCMLTNLEQIFSESIEQGFSRGHIENIIIESILKKYEDAENRK